MNDSNFNPTLCQQVSLSFAYLAYSGERLTSFCDPKTDPNNPVPKQILQIMNDTMPNIHSLLNPHGNVDWQIVWGPAIYTFPHAILQDNMMYVAQQISSPSNYVVAVRGTNGLAFWDWVEEDLEVLRKVPWNAPKGVVVQGTPMISKATQDGLDVLLNSLIPGPGMPASGQNITTFLSGLVASGKVNLLFTGHSLGGALSPTLALWFKQSQNLPSYWDPNVNASISAVPFAGPTAGNQDFATFFNAQLGAVCDRIYNTLDVVPLVWETDTMKQLPSLYLPSIRMPLAEKLLVEFLEKIARGYVQPNTGNRIPWDIQPEQKGYIAQAGVQHLHSYPNLLGVPELLTVIDRGKIF